LFILFKRQNIIKLVKNFVFFELFGGGFVFEQIVADFDALVIEEEMAVADLEILSHKAPREIDVFYLSGVQDNVFLKVNDAKCLSVCLLIGQWPSYQNQDVADHIKGKCFNLDNILLLLEDPCYSEVTKTHF
jgi:hypothetical protein